MSASIVISQISGTAREGNLSWVGTHSGSSLYEHDLRACRAVTDQDQHCGGPGTDSWPDCDHLVQPGLLGQGVSQVVEPLRSLHCGIVHGVTPRCCCAKSRISCAELNGPA